MIFSKLQRDDVTIGKYRSTKFKVANHNALGMQIVPAHACTSIRCNKILLAACQFLAALNALGVACQTSPCASWRDDFQPSWETHCNDRYFLCIP